MPAAPFESRRRLLLAALPALAGAVQACATPEARPSAPAGDAASQYVPRRGQPGKDVMWIATPDQIVTRMLQLAQLDARDRLVDLGSGDGKIVIAAARQFSVRGRGLEYNPKMVALSRERAQAAGVAELTQFEQADIFQASFRDADVVTMYLLPELNLRLRPTLYAMRPGTRVVSHQWRMGNWQPDETSRIGGTPVHLWLVPANVGGEWALTYPDGSGTATTTLRFEQIFQRITRAEVEVDGMRNTVRDARLAGARLRFAFTDASGRLREFDGQVDGAAITGQVGAPSGPGLPFTARRTGTALPIPGSTGFTDEEAALGAAELGS